MKVGIVANSAFNLYNFRLSLIKKLMSMGYNVVALAPEDEFSVLLTNEGIEYYPLKNLSRKGSNPITDLKLLFELRRLYKYLKIDISLQFTIKPNIYGTIAAGKKIKTICTVTGLGYTFLSSGIASFIAKHLYSVSFSKANQVLFQNSDDLKLFQNKKILKHDNWGIVPGSGLNTQQFKPKTQKRTKNSFTFLFVGRLLYDKGILELQKSFNDLSRENKNVELHIIGKIDKGNPSALKKTDLDNWLKNNENVKFFGQQKDVQPFYDHSDAIVLPSYREGMPRVILEAMSKEKPVIVTDVPGCNTIVEENINGLLVKPKDPKSIKDAMQKMISLSDYQRNKLGKNGRKIVMKNYSTDTVNKIYIKLISQFERNFLAT